MTITPEPLSNLPLRDIHLPEPIGPWPPAPGWWLLGLLILLVGAGLLYHFRQRHRLRNQALNRLNELAGLPDEQLARPLSRLLRQAAVCHFPPEVAGLVGKAWLEFLDSRLAGRPFSEGVGRCLAEAPYQPTGTIDSQTLIPLCRRWLQTLPVPPPKTRKEGP